MLDHIFDSLLSSMMAFVSALPFWFWIILAALIVIRVGFGNVSHLANVIHARRCLKRLRQIDNAAQQFGYLRRVDPYVFEEMILSSLADLGHSITRNKKYSGDGGIDGRARIDGKKYLIQAKRYRGHISAQHVQDFARICRKKRRLGIFVHTGRTGQQAKVNGSDDSITILSGQKMLDLLNANQLVL